jgi:hypothetical protein
VDGKEQETLTDRQVRQPEIQFFMRVWFPCVIAYGQWPTRLFASARRGNVDALYKLLRIDKSILADPFIAKSTTRARESLPTAANGSGSWTLGRSPTARISGGLNFRCAGRC